MLTPDERENNRQQAEQWWEQTAPKSFGILPKPETEEHKQFRRDINKFHCEQIRKGREKYR